MSKPSPRRSPAAAIAATGGIALGALILLAVVLGVVIYVQTNHGAVRVEVIELSQVRLLEGHSNQVDCVAFSADGKHLYSGGHEKRLYRWNVATATGEVVSRPQCESAIMRVVELPDRQHVVTGHYNGDVTLWDLNSAEKVRAYNQRAKVISSLAVAPDGKRLLVSSNDGLVQLLDVDTGQAIYEFNEGFCGAAALSDDGQTAAHAIGSRIHFWSIDTGETLLRIEHSADAIFSMAFSPEGRTLVTGSGSGVVNVWNTSTGGEAHRLQVHSDVVSSIVFIPGGRHFVTGSEDKTIRVFDAASGRLFAWAECENHFATHVAVGPNGRTLASGGGSNYEREADGYTVHKDRDYAIRLWRLPDAAAVTHAGEQIVHESSATK